MTDNKEQDNELLGMIRNRSCLKRDIYENIIKQFEDLKSVLKKYADDLKENIHSFDDRIRVRYEEKSAAEVHLVVAGDILVFHIHIYNFLNDSFKFNRYNDLGYLIARLFINKEDHYFTEGKGELGYKFNDFVNSKIDKKNWVEIINTCLMYTLDFNLYVPPYNKINMVSVGEIMEKGASLQIKTGKRMGFQFNDERAENIT